MISLNPLSAGLAFLLTLVPVFSYGNREKCREVFEASLKQYPADSISYDWPAAIFLLGAERFAQIEGLAAGLDPYYVALAQKIPKIRDPDKASLSLPAVLKTSPEAKKIVAASRKFFSEEPKNSLGVIDHVGSRGFLGSIYPSSVWADSLVMSSLNQIQIATNEIERQQAINEARVMLQNLKSDTPGLFSHAVYPKKGWRFPTQFHWARGNLWIAFFLAELAQTNTDYVPVLKDQINGLKKFYVKGKGLRTLIDDPSSEFESSATALFGYALTRARLLGIEDSREIETDIRTVILGFVKDQKFTGVSGPTTAFPLPLYYRSLIPAGEYPYGTGAFLLWCSLN